MSSNSKKSFALVRVSNLDGSAPFSPRTFVTLHRRRYVVRSRGSSDNQGESVATLDCPGVSKKAHLEINAKMCVPGVAHVIPPCRVVFVYC